MLFRWCDEELSCGLVLFGILELVKVMKGVSLKVDGVGRYFGMDKRFFELNGSVRLLLFLLLKRNLFKLLRKFFDVVDFVYF